MAKVKIVVQVPEVHYQSITLEYDDSEETLEQAVGRIKDGDGDQTGALEYSYTCEDNEMVSVSVSPENAREYFAEIRWARNGMDNEEDNEENCWVCRNPLMDCECPTRDDEELALDRQSEAQEQAES